MNFLRSIFLIPTLLAEVVTPAFAVSPVTEKSVLDFTMKDIDGKDVPLSTYKGKVVLIVNVASRCGFTPQYEGLELLYQKYKDKGLVILGFPANNFLSQEPGTDQEIKSFCSAKYGVTFDMFSKISVRGKDKHPLYRFLTEKETDPKFSGEIQWNFQKFLVGRNGELVARFAPNVEPLSADVVQAVEQALAGIEPYRSARPKHGHGRQARPVRNCRFSSF